MDLSAFKTFDLFLLTKKRKIPMGEFPLTEADHKTKGPCGVDYIFQFEVQDDAVAVNVKATVPAGLEVSPGLVTETEEQHSLDFYLTDEHVFGKESKEFHVPPFGNTVFSIELA